MKQKGSQEKTAVELTLVLERMGAFRVAENKWSSPNDLDDYARTIHGLQTGEVEVRPLKEGDNERLLAWRVKHHCHTLIALKSAQGFVRLSLGQEIRQVEEMLYGLLKEIEDRHLLKYYNALIGSWGTEDAYWDNDVLYGPAYWAPGDSTEKVMASLEKMMKIE